MRNHQKIHVSRISIAILFFLTLTILLSPHVRAESQKVEVVVYIEKTGWNKCGDGVSLPDMYYEITINGQKHTTSEQSNCCNWAPWDVDQEVVEPIDIPRDNYNIPIVIAQYDADPGDDQLCDLYAGDHRRLYLNLDLKTKEISGDATGVVGQSISTWAGYDDPHFEFKILLRDPVSYSTLNMRCLHDPIWPQPGEEVTITANALDGEGEPIKEIVDNIEIFEGNLNNLVASTATTGPFGSNVLTYKFTPPSGSDQVNYVCRVTDEGLSISGPWRTTQIGDPAPYPWNLGPRQAVPILYRGPVNSAIDICFIADRDDTLYNEGARDSDFIADVGEAIRDTYYAADEGLRPGGMTFLKNQDKLNFWIALRTGTLEYKPPIGEYDGPGEYPSDWDSIYSFCDAGVIVHHFAQFVFTNSTIMADHICTASMYVKAAFLHELGHASFKLWDEYCCAGGYYQTERRPNIYEKYSDCMDDELVGTEIDPGDACSEIIEDETGENWFRLDPQSGGDLMRGGDYTSRPADLRRIDHKFNKCQGGGC